MPELHLRAARWFARNGLALQAVSHYGSAGCWQEAAEMVVDDGLIAGALRPSSPPLVQRLADMPEDTPGAPAGVVRAAVALARADVPACDVALDRVERAPGSAPEPALDVALAATRLASAATRPDPGQTLVCVTRAEAALSALGAGTAAGPGGPDHADLLSLLLSAKGLAQLATGDLRSAALTLTDAVGACVQAGFGPEQLANLARLALAEALQGHLNRARELVDAAVALAGEQAGTAAGPLPAALVVADAWTLVEGDDADAARQAMLGPPAPMEPDGAARHRHPPRRAVVARGTRLQDRRGAGAAHRPTTRCRAGCGTWCPGAGSRGADGRPAGGVAVGRRGPDGPAEPPGRGPPGARRPGAG